MKSSRRVKLWALTGYLLLALATIASVSDRSADPAAGEQLAGIPVGFPYVVADAPQGAELRPQAGGRNGPRVGIEYQIRTHG